MCSSQTILIQRIGFLRYYNFLIHGNLNYPEHLGDMGHPNFQKTRWSGTDNKKNPGDGDDTGNGNDIVESPTEAASPAGATRGFSDEEKEDEKVDYSDEEPSLHVLDDGRTVLVHLKENKQLVLPGKYEWTLEEAGKHGNAMIACVTGPFQKRKVKHALESSRTTAIGVEIPVEAPIPPPVKPKRTVNLKVASTSSTPAPIAPAEAKKPAAAEEATFHGSEHWHLFDTLILSVPLTENK